MDLPERLQQARERAGHTQESAAREIGVGVGTISRYERGKMGLRLEVAEKLAVLYDVSVDWLVRGTASNDSRVELDHVDTPAWRELVELGWLDRYRRRGLSEAQIEYARRTLFRGAPTVDDYVDVLEAMVRALARPEAPEMAAARAKSERDGTPSAKHWVPEPPEDEKPEPARKGRGRKR